MSRLPVAAFAALVAATVAAFFVTQHLKVTTPLIAGIRAPNPEVINPRGGTSCAGVDYRVSEVSFYLLHRADDVDVYVTDQSGAVIRTLASGRHMRRGVRNPDGNFYWNGREDNGTLAPDGTYFIEVALIHQGRTVILSNAAGPLPVKVKTVPPRPVVESVSPHLIGRRGPSVTIHYFGNEDRGGTVEIYRTDLPGAPRLVKSFLTPWMGRTAVWDGKIRRRPAPAGIYLVGLNVTDAACNTGHFPPQMPPAPGSTPYAGVTMRYLAVQPPLEPVPAGTSASVYVDSRQRPYRWTLRRLGAGRPLASGRSNHVRLQVPLPAGRAGLYKLSVRAGSDATAVPLAASGPSDARALVVLPALTWQGLNPIDDTGDGMPSTLADGRPVALARPLADGLPAALADEGALLRFLDGSRRSYQLTTDLGLIEGVGPALAPHSTVVLAGSERWLPARTAAALRAFVAGGGHVLSLGIDSLRRGVTIRGGEALDPTGPARTDALSAQPGALVTHAADLIVVSQDRLGIFQGTSGALGGYRSYQPFTVVAPAQALSEAGATPTAPSIVGYRLGRGTVVDIGLPGFGASLAGNVDAHELLARIWKVLGA
ncbi:MAG: hypothetical protein JO168_11560 [Solirubrobacterales bacterium]|nr:hypothetical protein [Solirubrobacterales bacterium]MBV9716534.1 hypothetical protein [Solirubrobacterales bacterium]